MGSDSAFPLIASAIVGGAVFSLAWTFYRLLTSEELQQEDDWRYDVSRINSLRRHSILYRLLYPLFRVLAAFNRRAFSDQLHETGRLTLAAGHSRFWTAEEYLALMEVQTLFALPLLIYVCVQLIGPPGIVLAFVLASLLFVLLRRRLRNQAMYRLWRIKLRLPYLLDLLTLLMEAGSTFLNALREAVGEYRDHPVGAEFGRVLAEMNMGKSRTAALESLKQRLDDDEISSLIGSIMQGETLGTPLATLFRTQADVLRLKRSQRAETLAGEAGVKMLLPAILIMAATVLIILGPFVISFVYQDFM